MRQLVIILGWLTLSVYGGEKAEVKSFALLDNETTKPTAEKLQSDLAAATATYYEGLQAARIAAANKSAIDEVKLIDQAIDGQAVENFTTPGAVTAHKNFYAKLLTANKTFVGATETAIRQLLQNGDNDGAAYLKELAANLSQYHDAKKSATQMRKNLKVNANQDWQKLNITLPKNANVKTAALGKWAPGLPKINERLRQIEAADADTYNVELRIGKQTVSGGKKFDFTTQTGGEVEARMLPTQNRFVLSEATGALLLAFQWSVDDKTEREPLEKVLRELLAPPSEVITDDGEKKREKRLRGDDDGERPRRRGNKTVSAQ